MSPVESTPLSDGPERVDATPDVCRVGREGPLPELTSVGATDDAGEVALDTRADRPRSLDTPAPGRPGTGSALGAAVSSRALSPGLPSPCGTQDRSPVGASPRRESRGSRGEDAPEPEPEAEPGLVAVAAAAACRRPDGFGLSSVVPEAVERRAVRELRRLGAWLPSVEGVVEFEFE